MEILVVSLCIPNSKLHIFFLLHFTFPVEYALYLQELKFQRNVLETTKALIFELHPLKTFI